MAIVKTAIDKKKIDGVNMISTSRSTHHEISKNSEDPYRSY
jgi:hypothetical protein